jgi:hypothetical protein
LAGYLFARRAERFAGLALARLRFACLLVEAARLRDEDLRAFGRDGLRGDVRGFLRAELRVFLREAVASTRAITDLVSDFTASTISPVFAAAVPSVEPIVRATSVRTFSLLSAIGSLLGLKCALIVPIQRSKVIVSFIDWRGSFYGGGPMNRGNAPLCTAYCIWDTKRTVIHGLSL